MMAASVAQADCRQALALGLDVSGSVDRREYRVQLDGLAGALQNENVRAALLSMPNAPVTLAVYEWSGPADQHLIVNWTTIRNQNELDSFTARLLATRRKATDPSTAIGSSLIYGAALLSKQPKCWTHTLDLSGDGSSNSGPRPRDVAGETLLNQITVNALVISKDSGQTMQAKELAEYFESEVIRGTGAFTELALGFDDFQNAMVRKLLRELQGLTVSKLGQIQ